MHITGIEPIHVSIPFEHGAPRPSEGLGAGGRFDALFVRVDTDAGVTGWGEAFGYAAGPVTMAALTRMVAPLAIGRDPQDIAALIRSRTGEGRARAKARGVRFGRKPKLTAHQVQEALGRRQAGEALSEIGRSYNVSHSTISRLG
jgi:L-alanine-DL-glutamate epimerase-like enolase superfamily enzyme